MFNKLSTKSLFALLSILIAIIIYFVIIIDSSINFPVHDDYPSILSFLINYDDATSLIEKINLIYTQHNEHRIIFGKILTLCYYKIFGEINFIHLIFLGNIPLIGIAYILFKSLKIDSLNKRLFVFVPLTIFLFNYSYYEVSCWAMASIQNIWVLLFAFLSLYYLVNDKKQSLLLAILFASIATFTSGNGIMVFIAGILILILKKENKTNLLIWATFFLLNAFAYFIELKKVSHHPSFLKSFIAHPFDLLLYPMSFIGSLFWGHVTVVGIVIGAGILCCCIYFLIKKIYVQNYVLFSFLIFMTLTVCAVTFSRFGFGIAQSTSSRYMINSTLIFMIVALLLIQIYQTKLNVYIWVGTFIFVVVFNVISFNSIKNQRNVIKSAIRNIDYINSGKFAKYNLFYPPGNDATVISILRDANKNGIYKTDSIGYSSKPYLNKIPFKIDSNLTRFAIDEFKQLNDSIYRITGWGLLINKPSYNISIAIGLEDSLSNLYTEVPSTLIRPDVTNAFISENCDYYNSGFSKEININNYLKGNYKVSLLIISDSTNIKVPLKQIIKK